MARFGRPEIFNTDQGSQFTSPRFTCVPKEAGVRIGMDGRGRRMDNVFIERRGGRWAIRNRECRNASSGNSMWMNFEQTDYSYK